MPSNIVKNYYLNKYNLDKEKEYPYESYILMAMEEGPRGNGWYNEERAGYALKNSKKAKEEYTKEIGERLKYFSQNLIYTSDFYIKKIASMWTENTYSAIFVNSIDQYKVLDNAIEPILFYQKILLIIMCVCILFVITQNRKNISLEIIFLLTIFIGGFLFHILWEAKSRYILPYVVILIPIASIAVNKLNCLEKIKANLIKILKTHNCK